MIYGLQQSGLLSGIQLHLDIPAVTALKFMHDEVDVALLPCGVLPRLNNYKIITNNCIGAINQVKTVAIFANQPLEQLDKIYLDYQSRTSVELLRILLKEYWKLPAIELLPASEGFEQRIKENEAALLIGDKTFPFLADTPYQYDLATAWHEHTGLPFAFAVWVAKPTVSEEWITLFDKALETGVANRNQLAFQLAHTNPEIDWMDYFYNCISYNLDDAKRKAIKLFTEKIQLT